MSHLGNLKEIQLAIFLERPHNALQSSVTLSHIRRTHLTDKGGKASVKLLLWDFGQK